MIDLTHPALPTCLVVDGEEYQVDTSFRTWMRFGKLLQDGIAWRGVFKGEVPKGNWLEAACEFLESPNATPVKERGRQRVLDLILDGEYITAAFQQAYGIDLTEGDMHWHRFKALLNGVPDSTRLAQIMQIRGYEKPPAKQDADAEARKRQRQWALPSLGEEEARADMVKWAETFFGA